MIYGMIYGGYIGWIFVDKRGCPPVFPNGNYTWFDTSVYNTTD